MVVVGLIPARGGSKGIPRKNLVTISDRPLIAYSIVAGLEAKGVDHVLVSTDDNEIAEVSQRWGAKVPFMRPAEIASDEAPMLGVVAHALDWCEKHLGVVEAMVLLQPTSPLRQPNHIDDALDIFRRENASSVVSVVKVPHNYNPYSVMRMSQGRLEPFLTDLPQIRRRQNKPAVYARNGPSVLVSGRETIQQSDLYGERVFPYLMAHEDSLDIDEPGDIELLSVALLNRQKRNEGL